MFRADIGVLSAVMYSRSIRANPRASSGLPLIVCPRRLVEAVQAVENGDGGQAVDAVEHVVTQVGDRLPVRRSLLAAIALAAVARRRRFGPGAL